MKIESIKIFCQLKIKPTAKTLLLAATLVFVQLTDFRAQDDEIQFTHLTAEDGLSLSGVTQILQDKRGFLWFGTYYGLNKYDGYNFKIFLPEPNNPKSISNHSIWSLCEDREGFIWIATLDGLNRYNWKTEEFRIYKYSSNDSRGISNSYILDVFEDKDGTVWIGTINGLSKYNRDGDNFTIIMNVNDQLNSDGLNSVTCIEEDYIGNLWLGTWNGLTCMKKDGTIINTYYAESGDSKTFDYRKISYLFEDNLNNLWIGLNGKGLDKFNPYTGKFTHYTFSASDDASLSNNYVTVIYQDKSGEIWIGTKDGLNKYNPKKNNFTRIMHLPDRPLSIITNEILSIKEDYTGIIWVGTTAGISRFFKPNNKFDFYQVNSKNPQKSLISNRIHAVHSRNKDKLWVGTFEGLDEIDIPTGKVIHHRNKPGNKNSLSDNFVMSVLEDRRGNIWIGTSNSGLNKYNPATGEFKLYKYDVNDTNSISNNGAISLCETRDGSLWVGTWWGLNRLDEKTGNFYTYHANLENPHALSHDLIWTIYEDSQGMIWLGTDGGGVNILNPKTNVFTRLSHDSAGTNYISANRAFSLYESSDGIMWLGTSEGINSYDRRTGKITIYNNKNGLPGKLINGIQEDDKKNLWISTEKGLSKFSLTGKTFINYTKRNGLKEMEFDQNVSYKSPSGIIYFSCKSGLMYFNPDSIKSNKLSAPLVFTDLKIFNQSVPISNEANSILTESITGQRILSISYKYSVITIEFALLDYFNAKRNNFSYKLVGFDTEWNEVGNRNNATYTNLPPGDYIFIVRANNSEGISGVEEALLKIIIVPAFYQTLWFQAALVLGLLLFTFITMQRRTQKIQKLNRVLENRVAERTKDLDKTILELSEEIIERKRAEEKVQASLEEKEILLKEIHHRVKNNLQVISSILYLQSRSVKDQEMLNLFDDSQNRIKSMALIHEKLYQSKDFSELNFKEYVDQLVEHLNQTFKKKKLHIKTKVNVDNINLSLDTAISCGLIVNELMTNSYKYAFPAEWAEQKSQTEDLIIEISVEDKGDKKFVLVVHDNGVGVPENFNVYNSDTLGLKLVNSMVGQLDGSIEISNTNGTTVKIIFTDNKN